MNEDVVASSIIGQAKVYSSSRGWKVFFSILTLPLIILMVAFIFMPFIQNRANNSGYVLFCLFLGSGGALLFSYCFFSILKNRIEIYPDRIRKIGLFESTEILIGDIKGFKVLPTQYIRTLLIVPKDATAKKIEVGLILDNQKDFLDWINQNFKNLDIIKTQEEKNLILQDAQFGQTPAERSLKLGNAQIASKILNGLGLAVTFWVMFWPYPYVYAILASIVMPFICLFIVYHYKGLIRLNGQRGSVYPDATAAFILPSMALAFRAMNDWHILNWNNFGVPFVEVLIFFIFLVFILVKDIQKNISTALLMIIFCGAYAYGGVISFNGLLDRSRPVIYAAQITQKRISTGKHTTYYFELSPWGPKDKTEEVSVGRLLYNICQVGDGVKIFLKKGRIGINWFYIRDAFNERGIEYRRHGDLPQAISNYTKAIEINPYNVAAYWNRGLAHDMQGNLSQAIFDYTKVIELYPHDARVFNNRGIDFAKQGNLSKAISDYTKAIGVDPKHAHAYNNRAVAYDWLGNNAQAIADYKKALAIDPNYADARIGFAVFYNERGTSFYKQHDFSKAILEFTKAIEINPKYAMAYYNLGVVYNNQGNSAESSTYFNKAFAINPQLKPNYSKQYESAGFIPNLTKTIGGNPKDANAYFERAKSYYRLGSYDQALADYNKAIELNPNYAAAYNNRAYVHLFKKQYEEAVADIKKAIALGYDNGSYNNFIKLVKQRSAQDQ